MENARARFSDRVDDYTKYRPSYPAAVVEFLHGVGVPRDGVVADVGAGTGISTKLFLDAGHPVVAIEPNAPMRAACDAWLGPLPGYRSVEGSSDATTLGEASVALVTVAQAFHWFDRSAAKREFLRILRPEGKVALVWNNRRLRGTEFLSGYEALLRRYGTDYAAVADTHPDDAALTAWFGVAPDTTTIPSAQQFDFSGLRGRLLSSSYAPKPGHPSHEPMLTALRELFERTADAAGRVTFEYDTRVYCGRPTT